MLPAEAPELRGRTAADNQTVRNVFVIGPDKKIKLIIAYPMTTGRNFDEVLRVIDSMQLTAKHRVATPVNWKQGEDVIMCRPVSDDEAKKIYPDGWKASSPTCASSHSRSESLPLAWFSAEWRRTSVRVVQVRRCTRASTPPCGVTRVTDRSDGRA